MNNLSTAINKEIIIFLDNLNEVSNDDVYPLQISGTSATLYMSANPELVVGTDTLEHSKGVFYIGYSKS